MCTPFTACATVNVTWCGGPGGFTPSQPCPLLEVPLPSPFSTQRREIPTISNFFPRPVQPRVEYVCVCVHACICMLTTARLVSPRMWADLTPDRARQPSKGTPSWNGQVSESSEGPAWPPSPVAVISTPSVAGVCCASRCSLNTQHSSSQLSLAHSIPLV